jgi:hypothetical protein
MKKKPQAFVGLLLFLLLAVVVLVFQQFLTANKKIDIGNLDMSLTNLPGEFNCDWHESDVSWDYFTIDEEQWISDYVPNPNVDIKAFQWIDEKDGGVIHLAIVDYKIPLNAHLHYYLLDPSQRKKEYFENFSNNKQNIVPPGWTWVNQKANRESVQCGAGSENKCYGWFYRAQYGQYYLYIHDNGPACMNFFEQVVIEINKEFSQHLE